MATHESTMQMPIKRRLVAVRIHGPEQAPRDGSPAKRRLLDLKASQQVAVEERKILDCIVNSIQEALARTAEQVDERLDAVSSLTTELGLAVAREIVGAALDQGLVDPTPVVRRCLQEAVAGASDEDRGGLQIYLNPQDVSLVLGRLEEEKLHEDRMAGAQFHADPAMQRGVVRVESGHGRLVYDPLEVLDRVSNEIRKEAGE